MVRPLLMPIITNLSKTDRQEEWETEGERGKHEDERRKLKTVMTKLEDERRKSVINEGGA